MSDQQILRLGVFNTPYCYYKIYSVNSNYVTLVAQEVQKRLGLDFCCVGMSEIWRKKLAVDCWISTENFFKQSSWQTEQWEQTVKEFPKRLLSLFHLLFCSLYLILLVIVAAPTLYSAPRLRSRSAIVPPSKGSPGPAMEKAPPPKEMKQSFLGFSVRNELHCVSCYQREDIWPSQNPSGNTSYERWGLPCEKWSGIESMAVLELKVVL